MAFQKACGKGLCKVLNLNGQCQSKLVFQNQMILALLNLDSGISPLTLSSVASHSQAAILNCLPKIAAPCHLALCLEKVRGSSLSRDRHTEKT
jgi:hypothetical protein